MPASPVLAATASLAVAASSDLAGAQWFAIAGVVLGGFALYRAGSVRAWRETAEARDARIGDLEAQLAALNAELALPERIEGIVRLMSDTAERTKQGIIEHELHAAERSRELLVAIERLRD